VERDRRDLHSYNMIVELPANSSGLFSGESDNFAVADLNHSCSLGQIDRVGLVELDVLCVCLFVKLGHFGRYRTKKWGREAPYGEVHILRYLAIGSGMFSVCGFRLRPSVARHGIRPVDSVAKTSI
jgi:hypothetical protein